MAYGQTFRRAGGRQQKAADWLKEARTPSRFAISPFERRTRAKRKVDTVRKLILAAVMVGAAAAHAEDYHKATALEQAKAACEIYADTYKGANTMPWGAQHARAYDSCMTLRGYARN
jgi:hypothetical protein